MFFSDKRRHWRIIMWCWNMFYLTAGKSSKTLMFSERGKAFPSKTRDLSLTGNNKIFLTHILKRPLSSTVVRNDSSWTFLYGDCCDKQRNSESEAKDATETITTNTSNSAKVTFSIFNDYSWVFSNLSHCCLCTLYVWIYMIRYKIHSDMWRLSVFIVNGLKFVSIN